MAFGEPLTIAHISTQRDWYGGEEQAGLLAQGLLDRGHRCVVFARHGGAFAQRVRAQGIDVRTFTGNGRRPGAILQLRRELARLRPDVVHFHDAHAVTTGGLAALGLSIPARIASRRCDYPLRWAAKYTMLSDRIVAVSQNVADVCVQCGVPEGRVHVVYDGVDPARPHSGDADRGRAALGRCNGETILLTVASLSAAKGHADLLDALPSLLDRHPDVRVAFAGEGKLRPELQRAADRLGVRHAVRFLGYREDVPDLLQAADLFVMPSRIEPLGSSLVEAMLAGVPIVSTTAGGIPELVGRLNGEAAVAYLSDPGNPAELGRTIATALVEPSRRRELAARAAGRAQAMFTAEQMVENTLAVYAELVPARAVATA